MWTRSSRASRATPISAATSSRPAARLAAALLATLLLAAPAASRGPVGQPAKPFTIRLADGGEIASSALAGQVVILNRWAVWCVPCREELPALDAYQRAHARQGLRVFAATIDDSASARQLAPLAAKLSFPLARSIRGGYPILGGVPTSYVIDRLGIVRYARAGALDAELLDEVVGPLLAEPPPG